MGELSRLKNTQLHLQSNCLKGKSVGKIRKSQVSDFLKPSPLHLKRSLRPKPRWFFGDNSTFSVNNIGREIT